MNKSIDFISLFLLLLITGVFWGTWFPLTRSLEDFSIAEFIHIGKIIISNVAIPMSIIMPSGILFMLLSMWFYKPKKSVTFYFAVLAFIFIVITLLITLIVLVPIDNEIKKWTADTAPLNWEAIRERWRFYHATRTTTSLVSFGCFGISIVFKQPRLAQ